MNSILRFLPLLVALGLVLGALFLMLDAWNGTRQRFLSWLVALLSLTLAVVLAVYGLRLLREHDERSPGSHLRSKLVIAMVAMLLAPAMTLQITANQMVERSLNSWFDVRVGTLLDQALQLAQGFYTRVQTELKQSVSLYVADAELIEYMNNPAERGRLTGKLNQMLTREGWQRVMLYDTNEQLLAAVRQNGLATLKAPNPNENVRLAMQLGQIITDVRVNDDGDVAIAYAPISDRQGIVGMLRAEIFLPVGVVQNARAVEADFKRYRALERDRQQIAQLFADVLLLVTLIVVFIAGWAALIFARRLTAPVADLANALQQITEGELDVSVPVRTNDELGSLAHSFNRMSQTLKENVHELEHTQRDLQQTLSDSTSRQLVLETLLANLQSGVILLNHNGHIRLMNNALRNLLELPDSWQIDADFTQLCSGRLQPLYVFFEQLHMQQSIQQEQNISIDKKQLHLLLRGVRLDDDYLLASYLLVVDDFSSLAEAQRNRAWAEVARRLAHEIKNPLTPIKLNAERLQRRFSKQVDASDIFDRCTLAIITQVERLQRLVNDFSALSRVPKAKLKLVSVNHLLEEMRGLYQGYGKCIHVSEPDCEVSCLCDADQIRQVLINLLDNALAANEHSDANTIAYPLVRLYITLENTQVQWHVEDDGDGIKKDHIAQLFEPYFSTKADGSGLGLAIASRIIDEHESHLLLITPAKPTHFSFTLLRTP
ncbi:MAG: HAMP domain-containing protein [Mariprofundales bacterium]